VFGSSSGDHELDPQVYLPFLKFLARLEDEARQRKRQDKIEPKELAERWSEETGKSISEEELRKELLLPVDKMRFIWYRELQGFRNSWS